MSDNVIVASRLPLDVLMQAPAGETGIENSTTIVGQRDLNSLELSGWGLTYNVDGPAFAAWLAANPLMAEFMTVVTQQQIDEHSDPSNTHGYELGLEEVPVIPPIQILPPVNVDIPYIWQEEQRMRCTMGNWENEPVSYDYQWMQDGTLPIGPNNDTLPMLASNDGHTITCIVTAINTAGAVAAPPSNEIVYHAPTEATSALLISGDFNDTEWSAMISQIGGNGSAWQGFDIVVDGLNLTLRAQCLGVVDAQGICAVINGALGAYLTASSPTTDAPWQFNIHSNSTGVTSTIGYAAAPSYIATDDSEPNKATTDLSLLMRLRQSVGAITVQGIDASGAETMKGTS
jgi:hypothetical protein